MYGMSSDHTEIVLASEAMGNKWGKNDKNSNWQLILNRNSTGFKRRFHPDGNVDACSIDLTYWTVIGSRSSELISNEVCIHSPHRLIFRGLREKGKSHIQIVIV